MGTFTGHFAAGTFLSILGTWWAFSAWRNYILCKQRNRRYKCRSWYVMPGVSRRICLEGLGKMIVCSIGITGEVATSFKDGRFVHMVNAQHASIYLLYVVSGLVDVLTNCRFPFPPGTDYAMLLLAVTVEGMLFHFHLYGRPNLDVLIHTLLVCTVAAEAACILAEMNRPRSILASLGRAFFCLLQGTWLCQIGFILYSPLPGAPSWDVNSHADMMLATAVLTWHIIGVLAFLALVGVLASLSCNACDCDDDPVQEAEGSHYALLQGLEDKVDIHVVSEKKTTARPKRVDYSDDDFLP